MADIVSRTYTEQGRSEHDRIFGPPKRSAPRRPTFDELRDAYANELTKVHTDPRRLQQLADQLDALLTDRTPTK